MPRPQERSLVRNAADKTQIAHANRVLAKRDNSFVASLQVVLGTAEGRLVLWHLIGSARVFDSVWDPSARIHYNAGQQDYGQWLLRKAIEADENLYQLMEREGRARQRAEDAGTDAIQQRAKTEGDRT